MFTTDLVNLYNRNIFKTSLYIYIFQDEKCRLVLNLSIYDNFHLIASFYLRLTLESELRSRGLLNNKYAVQVLSTVKYRYTVLCTVQYRYTVQYSVQ